MALTGVGPTLRRLGTIRATRMPLYLETGPRASLAMALECKRDIDLMNLMA
jgi:hypothetical protein